MRHFKHSEYKLPEDRKIGGISKTVPDQSMSLKTILERYANNMPLDGIAQSQPFYGSTQFDSLGRDPRVLDLTEVDSLVRANKETITQHLEAENKKKSDKQKKADRDALKAQIRAELEQETKPIENQ